MPPPLFFNGMSVTNIGDFAQMNNCPSALASGASCTIAATFTPTMTGKRTAKIAVSDTAQ
jgi:hypothetical protein